METPRATWKAFWKAYEPSFKGAEGKLASQEQAEAALHRDADWQKACVQEAQQNQARLESRRQAAVAKAQSLERQRPQYAQDQETVAKMHKENQERENQMTSDRSHQTSASLAYHRELRRSLKQYDEKNPSR